MGHLFFAQTLKWNIKKITIYPFGGIIKFNILINHNLNEELLVLAGGFIFQTIYFLFIFIFKEINIINQSTFLLFKEYYFIILFFNLLPIYPLDGIKIVNIFINKLKSFKSAHILSIYISFIALLSFILININKLYSYNILLITSVLLISIIKEIKNHKHTFNKFLLERYLHDFNFKKIKKVSSLEKMRINKKHLIKERQKYITERQKLSKIFERKVDIYQGD